MDSYALKSRFPGYCVVSLIFIKLTSTYCMVAITEAWWDEPLQLEHGYRLFRRDRKKW